jgi:hypothetical protein
MTAVRGHSDEHPHWTSTSQSSCHLFPPSGVEVKLTIWGDKATANPTQWDNHPVLAVKVGLFECIRWSDREGPRLMGALILMIRGPRCRTSMADHSALFPLVSSSSTRTSRRRATSITGELSYSPPSLGQEAYSLHRWSAMPTLIGLGAMTRWHAEGSSSAISSISVSTSGQGASVPLIDRHFLSQIRGEARLQALSDKIDGQLNVCLLSLYRGSPWDEREA